MKKYFLLCALTSANIASAEDVGLTWYDNGTAMSGGPSSCTVGGTFTPPTPPTRPGYVFAGWKTITCKDKIKSLDSSTRCGSDNNRAWTKLDGTAGQNEANYGLTPGSGEWAVKFSYGTIWGQANCSIISASIGSTTSADLQSTGGKYCLCQIRGFSASGNNYTSGPKCTIRPISTYWISANNTYDSEDKCRTYCAALCSSQMCWRQDNWRPTAFSIAGQ